MTENGLLLTNAEIYPSDEFIFSIIGEKKNYWQTIMKFMFDNYKDSSGGWNFYNDGKRWLFKMIHKKKTVFWIGIIDETFRVTFWFSDKAEQILNESSLSESLKEQFKTSKKYGSIRAVTVKIENNSDVDDVLRLIYIKNSIK